MLPCSVELINLHHVTTKPGACEQASTLTFAEFLKQKTQIRRKSDVSYLPIATTRILPRLARMIKSLLKSRRKIE
ncbi:MAG: hypothetical protein A2283_17705 [Lentisphaerae bacterium RIFOXYA12_FULL_48_11]|nr:MAG: hypothetical protein A2283_17705 [Lentisphaerae bacterium RIFOXYA12_FULL_48_11]